MNSNKDFLFIFDSDPELVSQEIIGQFRNTSDAISWSFKNRKKPEYRSVQWLSDRLCIRRQRLSRMLNHGDYKMDASLIPMWDFLVGNTAVSQYIQLCFDRFKQERQLMREKVIEEKGG